MPPYTPQRIKELRRRAGLSQEAFAQALNVTTSTVTKWESGKATPRSKAALAALAAFERGVALRVPTS